ncbi:hypothetical protein [Paraburkholderia youngii]|uniref:hypothetical protein n=1 Tax=Paraburkholderia youngii TaxID=2782701 RepID=UPI003D2028AA
MLVTIFLSCGGIARHKLGTYTGEYQAASETCDATFAGQPLCVIDSFFKFNDDDFVLRVFPVFDLMMRTVSPDHVTCFALNFFLFAVFRSDNMAILKVNNHAVASGSRQLVLQRRVPDSQDPHTIVFELDSDSHNQRPPLPNKDK